MVHPQNLMTLNAGDDQTNQQLIKIFRSFIWRAVAVCTHSQCESGLVNITVASPLFFIDIVTSPKWPPDTAGYGEHTGQQNFT